MASLKFHEEHLNAAPMLLPRQRDVTGGVVPGRRRRSDTETQFPVTGINAFKAKRSVCKRWDVNIYLESCVWFDRAASSVSVSRLAARPRAAPAVDGG